MFGVAASASDSTIVLRALQTLPMDVVNAQVANFEGKCGATKSDGSLCSRSLKVNGFTGNYLSAAINPNFPLNQSLLCGTHYNCAVNRHHSF